MDNTSLPNNDEIIACSLFSQYFSVMNSEMGKWIIGAGLVIVGIGLGIYFLGDKLNLLGRLPGDIRVERENFSFYFPVTSMILISIIVSLLLRLVHYLGR